MPALRHGHASTRAVAVACLVVLAVMACRPPEGGPRELLERYFSTAVLQDYAATWECYDRSYRSKVPRDEFVEHRREASRLSSWKILSLVENGDRARADVELVFAPAPALGRLEPASTTVIEDLVREQGRWRIRIW